MLSLPKTLLLQKREHTRAPLVAVVAAAAVAAAAVLLLLLLLLELLAHKVAVELAQEVFQVPLGLNETGKRVQNDS